jgi:hypothetical protein
MGMTTNDAPFQINADVQWRLDHLRVEFAEVESCGTRGVFRMRHVAAICRLAREVAADAETYQAQRPEAWRSSDEGVTFGICLEMWQSLGRGEVGNPPGFNMLAALNAVPERFA